MRMAHGLVAAGLVIEQFAEPSASKEVAARVHTVEDTRVAPLFLHVHAQAKIDRKRSAFSAVAIALHHAEECAPGANSLPILMREDASDLVEVVRIMRCPGCEQLGECYRSE